MLDSEETDSDLLLVRRFLEGDETAFDELVSRHRTHVFNICLQMLGSRVDAEDAAQEAFVAAYRGLPKFRMGSKISTWLHRIAINRCISYRRSRRVHFVLDEEPEAPMERFDESDKRRSVNAALQRMSKHYRAVLVLKYYRGYSYDEISQVLGWSPEKVKNYLHRARNIFKLLYEREDQR